MRKISLLIIWLGFIFYSVFLAPDGNGEYLSDLMTMNDPDPGLLAMFSLLGVVPAVFAILLLQDDRGSVPAWPFVLGSFAFGAFSLLPYFILNNNKDRSNRTPDKVAQFLQSKGLLVVLILLTLFLFGYGILAGDPNVYQTAFGESNFVHVMTIDFVVLTMLSVIALYDRNYRKAFVGLVPIIGSLLIVMKRK
ncbi:MAG: hypothetical protein WBV93_15475 [Anaerobacillus sp.]